MYVVSKGKMMQLTKYKEMKKKQKSKNANKSVKTKVKSKLNKKGGMLRGMRNRDGTRQWYPHTHQERMRWQAARKKEIQKEGDEKEMGAAMRDLRHKMTSKLRDAATYDGYLRDGFMFENTYSPDRIRTEFRRVSDEQKVQAAQANEMLMRWKDTVPQAAAARQLLSDFEMKSPKVQYRRPADLYWTRNAHGERRSKRSRSSRSLNSNSSDRSQKRAKRPQQKI